MGTTAWPTATFGATDSTVTPRAKEMTTDGSATKELAAAVTEATVAVLAQDASVGRTHALEAFRAACARRGLAWEALGDPIGDPGEGAACAEDRAAAEADAHGGGDPEGAEEFGDVDAVADRGVAISLAHARKGSVQLVRLRRVPGAC